MRAHSSVQVAIFLALALYSLPSFGHVLSYGQFTSVGLSASQNLSPRVQRLVRQGYELHQQGEMRAAAAVWRVALQRMYAEDSPQPAQTTALANILSAYRSLYEAGDKSGIVVDALQLLAVYRRRLGGRSMAPSLLEYHQYFRQWQRHEQTGRQVSGQQHGHAGPPSSNNCPETKTNLRPESASLVDRQHEIRALLNIMHSRRSQTANHLIIFGSSLAVLGVASTALIFAGRSQSNEANRRLDMLQGLPPTPENMQIAADARHDGSVGNVLTISGVVTSIALVGGGVTMLTIGLQRRAEERKWARRIGISYSPQGLFISGRF